MTLGDLIIRIIVEGDKARAEVVRFESTVKRSGQGVRNENKKTKISFKSVGDAAQRAFFMLQTGAMALRGLESLSNAANRFEKAQRRLEGASKLTGVSLEKMQGDASAVKAELGLTTMQSNSMIESLTKLGAKSGDISKTREATKRLLDLAAARGYDAEQALVAIDQAILGIDEGTDKLFGKNPSVIYAAYAKSIGTTAGRLTDQQKAQSLLNAVMTDGLKVQGSYQDFLQSSAGKQALATARAGEAAAKFGQLYNTMKNIILELATPVLTFFAGMDTGLLKLITVLGGTIVLLVKLPAILGGISAALKVVGISANIAMGPIGIIIGIIGVLAAVWASNLGGIQEKTKAVFGYISSAFAAIGEFIKIIIERLVQRFKGFGKVIVGVFKGDLGMIKQGAKDVANSYVGGWDESLKRIKGKFDTHLSDVKTAQNKQKKAPSKPIVTPRKPSVDLAAAKKAEALRATLAAMRIANMTDEYEKQKAVVTAWYNEETKKYKGNAAILAELAIQKQQRLAKIDKDFAEKNKKAAAEQAKEKQQRADELAKLQLDAKGDNLARRSAEVDAWFSEEQAKWAGNAEALVALEQIKAQKIADIEQARRDQKRQADEQMWQDFQQQRQTYLETASAGYDEFWNSILNADITGKQRREQIWEAMRAAFVSSIAKRLKVYIAAKVKEGVVEQHASAAKRILLAKDSAVEAAHLSGSITKNLAAMAARLFAGLANLGPLGFLLGAGGVIGAIALVKNIVRGLRGFAKGGVIEYPELILAGEAGPEIIAPKQDFMQIIQKMQLQGAAAASGGGDALLANRIDALEKSIAKMKFTFAVDGRELAEANEAGLRLLTKNDI